MMDPEDLLLFAADAARLMLESGGETYRAEDVAMDIVRSQGGEEVDCFALSTGLMLSFTGVDGKVHSIIRRIKARGMNLEKASRIDTMVKDLRTDKIDIQEAMRRFSEIERLRERPAATRMLVSAIGAGFFALLFGGSPIDAIAAAIAGIAVARLILGFQRTKLPEFLTSLTGGALAVFSAFGFQALGLRINPDIVTIGIMMLLVPGVAITNAIRDLIAGDLVAGMARSVDAFITAASISVGAGGAYALWRLLLTGGGA